MKLIQFISDRDKVLYGEENAENGKTARVIDGNIFDRFSVTSEEINIKTVLPPVFPPNILAIGLNYKKHADETGTSYPEIPVLFIKSTTSLTGHDTNILLPSAGPDEVDFEAELGIIIGKRVKNVSVDKAMDCILGYTCVLDVSARDWQKRKQKKQWARGKSFDTFCPVGPYLVTADEIPDPNNLRIQCVINGKTFQDSNTSDMIFDVPTIVSNLSQSITLLPGTLILTGTPEGVGFTRQPPVFLKDGDRVSVIIEKIGELKNRVVKE